METDSTTTIFHITLLWPLGHGSFVRGRKKKKKKSLVQKGGEGVFLSAWTSSNISLQQTSKYCNCSQNKMEEEEEDEPQMTLLCCLSLQQYIFISAWCILNNLVNVEHHEICSTKVTGSDPSCKYSSVLMSKSWMYRCPMLVLKTWTGKCDCFFFSQPGGGSHKRFKIENG